MLLNPDQQLPTVPGSRIITETLGLVGVLIEDPHTPGRTWVIHNLFTPVPGRALGGIRAKLMDDKGFVSFINQRDLELLLEIARPGQRCPWTGSLYPGVNDHDDGWFGICCDADDLDDDLFEREVILRQQFGGIIPSNMELTRRIHFDSSREEEELLVFLWDKDPDTNYSPDPRMETMKRRWVHIERTRMKWSQAT